MRYNVPDVSLQCTLVFRAPLNVAPPPKIRTQFPHSGLTSHCKSRGLSLHMLVTHTQTNIMTFSILKGTTITIDLFLPLSPNVSTPPPCTGRSSSRAPFLHLPPSSILLLGSTNAQMQLRLQSIDLTSQSFLLGSDAISMILGTDAKQKEATDRCCANYTQPPMSVIYNSPCKQSFRHSYLSNMV